MARFSGGSVFERRIADAKTPRLRRSRGVGEMEESLDAIGRPGSDRLSRVLRRSIMGAEAFHGRVRNGIGCGRLAKTTRSANCIRGSWIFEEIRAPFVAADLARRGRRDEHGRMRTIKPIGRLVPVSFTGYPASTSGLSTWSSSTALIGNTRFQVGFPLRCLQRLSRPYIATLHCGWRHNRSTRGMSIPVLSY